MKPIDAKTIMHPQTVRQFGRDGGQATWACPYCAAQLSFPICLLNESGLEWCDACGLPMYLDQGVLSQWEMLHREARG